MWEFKILKQNGWNVLKNQGYWTPFLVCFVSYLLGASSFVGTGSSSSSSESYEEGSSYESLFPELESFWNSALESPLFIAAIITVCIVAIASTIAVAIFVSAPVAVGRNRFFMEHRAFGSKFSRLFWAFKCGNYLNVVKIMFWKEIKITLWTLLFIIPGIIKTYEYFMVPYILAENPSLSSKEVFALSKQMTKDEKMSILILELTFIGWYLLCILTCGIGYFFLEPYIQATYAELYQVMREKAHGLGFADYNELPGFFPEQK